MRISKATVNAIDDLAIVWDRVEKARAENNLAVSVQPKGSFTTRDYMERFKVSETAARRQLAKMVNAGSLESLRAFVVAPSGSVIIGNVYLPR